MRKNMLLGTFFLLLGISILVKIFFNVHLPLIRIAFAGFIIYWGVQILLGAFQTRSFISAKDSQSVLFATGDFHLNEEALKEETIHYSVVFGKANVDLRGLPAREKDIHVEVNTVFGEARVLLDPKTRVVIRANTVFGEARMPDENMVAFGTLNYRMPEKDAAESKQPTVYITGNVVFGSMRFGTAQ